jgi:hypothetical protein
MTEQSGGTTVVTEQEIARYAGRVRAALGDLAPTVRDELLEDLPEHLAEVAAEGEGSLVERLGPPETYAVELRTAAGVVPPVTVVNLDQRIASAVGKGRDRLRALDSRLGPPIGYVRLSEFLLLLRPAWWVLRGYLAAMLITVMLTGAAFGLLPRLGGSGLAAILLLAATVTGSIWLGRRTDRLGRRPRWIVHVGTVLLVFFGLVGFLEADSRATGGYNNNYSPVYTDQYSGVQDVYVYDSEGRLLTDVRLFDQNGEPIRLGTPWCEEAQDRLQSGPDFVDPMRQPYPYCPQGAPFQVRPTAPPSLPPSGSAEPTVSVGPTSSATPGGSPAPGASPSGAVPTPTPTPTT